MKILSLDYFEDDRVFSFDGHFENNGEYGQFFGSSSEPLMIKPNEMEFRDYEHYAGVFGKFNPYTFFLEDPIEVDELTIDNLKQIKGKFPQGR